MPAAAVLSLGRRTIEDTIRRLDYAHLGAELQLPTDGRAPDEPRPASEDAATDVAYWTAIDSEDWGATLRLLVQGSLHSPDAYLCELAQYAFDE